ncbi:MAG: D-sedoheptulose-7-phosphate isomerase [Acidimicrobiales bacterium]
MTSDGTSFLYPFIEAEERDSTSLLADLASSARTKQAGSTGLRSQTLEHSRAQIEAMAEAMAERFSNGGRLFVFGNGGSSTDAAGIVALFRTPPWGRPLRARSLAADRAVITALGNDVGFDLIFSRQLIAYARPADMALGVSTSGNSTNLLAAFVEARRREMLTLGLAGYDGGQMATSPEVQHCLVVSSDSVHRIQETQAALGFELWSRIQSLLQAGAVA